MIVGNKLYEAAKELERMTVQLQDAIENKCTDAQVSGIANAIADFASAGFTTAYGSFVTGVTITGHAPTPAALELEHPGTHQLVAVVAPAAALNQNVTWSTSDAANATVSATGLVTTVSTGPATITATTEDGSFTASVIVTVVDES